jgi:hypothetical protein
VPPPAALRRADKALADFGAELGAPIPLPARGPLPAPVRIALLEALGERCRRYGLDELGTELEVLAHSGLS